MMSSDFLLFFLDEQCGVADINMQALCKIPSHGSVDLHLKMDSISTAVTVQRHSF